METKKTLYHEPAREIPVIEADVLVAGAGTAGCVAAIAAARAGARVVLIERMSAPMGTLGNGGSSMYSFFAEELEPGRIKRVVGGIPYEMEQRFEASGASNGLQRTPGDPHRNPYKSTLNAEPLKATLCELLLEAGVELHLHTVFAGVDVEDGRIKAVFIQDKDGRKAVVAKQYIDCTGDADIVQACGLETVENWDRYDQVCGGPIGLEFAMANIDFDRACKEASDVFMLRSRKEEDGRTVSIYIMVPQRNPERCKHILELDLNFFSQFTSTFPGMAGVFNSKGEKLDASTADGLTRAEVATRIKMQKFAEALKKDIPGFEDAFVYWTTYFAAVRSSKIAVCDKMITQEDISAGARFEDEIGLYGFHDLTPKRPELFINHDGFYGFPYRMILPVGCKNLYVAGRCVTHDLEAHMSTRNTVGCMIMGQGAGVAAALCAAEGCDSRELPYDKLRAGLLAQDVILDA